MKEKRILVLKIKLFSYLLLLSGHAIHKMKQVMQWFHIQPVYSLNFNPSLTIKQIKRN